MTTPPTAEHLRLAEHRTRGCDWKKWGPYLSERAWGTVREDYSPDGAAWQFFPHDHARSRAYRWNEDGLAGICDRDQRLCFALALWNGRDPILKERLFGLAGPEGNHGEDVKEYYFYLDSTPTHSYMKMLYKYPQAAFPYQQLAVANRQRGREVGEYELLDTGVFDDQRYFDVLIEYAKASPDDLYIRITACNRGPEAAGLHLLPQLWFRNTWSWDPAQSQRPKLRALSDTVIEVQHPSLAAHRLYCGPAADGQAAGPELWFTDNETNRQRLWGAPNASPYVKDSFHLALINGQRQHLSPAREGTKAAVVYPVELSAGQSASICLRLGTGDLLDPLAEAETCLAGRQREADEFYAAIQPKDLDSDARSVQRQAFAGLLWTKQWYHHDVARWLQGDPAGPPPPPERNSGRNATWTHLNCQDVISMPDKWEYPWFAAWDLAFHCVPLAVIDPDFAKRQLILILREWYQHPNGQIPAYEWNFGDANPPVHAWAAWRVYSIEKAARGGLGDRLFLERVFHKLLLNFTWWVNRKDTEGNNLFDGGFLGLDNIGIFDRSAPLPEGGRIEQSDGTSWMGMYALNLMTIALELARENPAYEDVATKFFEHFLYIAGAMNNIAGAGIALWDTQDEFPYDVLHINGQYHRLQVRSMVGLIPLFAVETIDHELLESLPRFRRRMEWFLENRPQLAALVSRWAVPGAGDKHLLALMRGHRMKCILRRMLDPQEFLSDYGVRALSRPHAGHPYQLSIDGHLHSVGYEPAESRGGLFGGNSNWRGPIWFPVNYLIIESLRKFHHYYSDDFRVECPTGSGQFLSLDEIARLLSARLQSLFLRGQDGRRPVYGTSSIFQDDPHWRDHILFYEYFHGDTGTGLGASHQTGWTALVAELLQRV